MIYFNIYKSIKTWNQDGIKFLLKGHRDWFGASLLFHNDKLISCAPRSLPEKMEIKKLGFGSQWTGYRNMKENTGVKIMNTKLSYQ